MSTDFENKVLLIKLKWKTHIKISQKQSLVLTSRNFVYKVFHSIFWIIKLVFLNKITFSTTRRKLKLSRQSGGTLRKLFLLDWLCDDIQFPNGIGYNNLRAVHFCLPQRFSDFHLFSYVLWCHTKRKECTFPEELTSSIKQKEQVYAEPSIYEETKVYSRVYSYSHIEPSCYVALKFKIKSLLNGADLIGNNFKVLCIRSKVSIFIFI